MNNKVFFAFGKAVESKETTEFKRYVGIAPVQIVAINPSKTELEKIYNTTLEREPEYLGVREVNGQNVPFVRFDFIVKTNPEKSNGIEMTTKVSYFITKKYMMNNDGTKVKVIDVYGRSAWVTQDEYKNKLIPQYANGPARIDNNYKILNRGEEELLNFIKNYLGIQDVDEYANGVWRMRPNPEDYKAGFHDVDNWFKGDFSEIRGAVGLMPNNYVKLLFGVRTTDEGKEYQDVFTRFSAKFNSRSTKGFEKALNDARDSGAYPNTHFEVCDLKEYAPTPTNLDTPITNDDDLPFGDNPWK